MVFFFVFIVVIQLFFVYLRHKSLKTKIYAYEAKTFTPYVPDDFLCWDARRIGGDTDSEVYRLKLRFLL